VIAGQHHHAPNAERGEVSEDGGEAGAGRIGVFDRRDHGAIDRDVRAQLGFGRLEARECRLAVSRALEHERPCPDDHTMPVHRSRDATPGHFDDALRVGKRTNTDFRGFDERARAEVSRRPLDRPRQAQHIGRNVARRGDDLAHARLTDRDRAGLVEDGDRGRAHTLERRPVSHDDLTARGAVDAADDSDRRREDERAGGRDREHRQHPQPVAARDVRDATHEQRDRVNHTAYRSATRCSGALLACAERTSATMRAY
jgi:hypothetical protein